MSFSETSYNGTETSSAWDEAWKLLSGTTAESVTVAVTVCHRAEYNQSPLGRHTFPSTTFNQSTQIDSQVLPVQHYRGRVPQIEKAERRCSVQAYGNTAETMICSGGRYMKYLCGPVQQMMAQGLAAEEMEVHILRLARGALAPEERF